MVLQPSVKGEAPLHRACRWPGPGRAGPVISLLRPGSSGPDLILGQTQLNPLPNPNPEP